MLVTATTQNFLKIVARSPLVVDQLSKISSHWADVWALLQNALLQQTSKLLQASRVIANFFVYCLTWGAVWLCLAALGEGL